MKNIINLLSRYSFFIFLLLNLAIPEKLKSQLDQEIWYNKITIPPSPNASSLGEYGEVPVNKAAGLVNISIPVFDIKCGNLTLPISLGYHGGGIKVQESSSWVGLGWVLNAGGVITRNMQGMPDEKPGGFFQNAMKVPSPYSIDLDLAAPFRRDNTYDMLDDLTSGNGFIEFEPDMFYYNFNGKSGSFLFGNNNHPLVIPFDKIQITPVFNQGDITGFIVIDNNGITYLFGDFDGNNCTETTNVNVRGPDQPEYISSWYLNKIIDNNTNTVITFYYESYYYSQSVNYSFTKLYELVGASYQLKDPAQNISSTTISDAKCIKKITYDGGEVNFTNSSSDEGGKKIDKIEWQNNITKREFEFDYSYFSSTRLKLTGFKETSGDDEKEYSFLYNTIELPAKTSNAQDHWGYYNGETTNSTLIPEITIESQTFGDADREVDETYAKACILEKIVYPTNGYTKFIHGINKIGVGTATGGLRIEEIHTYDPVSNDTNYRSFDYCSSGYSTSGYPLVYYTDTKHVHGSPGGDVTTLQRLFYSSPVGGLGASSNNVAYSTVDELYGTLTNNQGKIRTSFYYAIDGGHNAKPYPPRISNQWKRSNVTKEQYYKYDTSTSTYKLTRQKDYSYAIDQNYSYFIKGFKATRVQTMSGDPLPVDYQNEFYYEYYTINTSWLRLDSETTQEVTNNDDTIRIAKNYYYDNPLHLNPTRIEWIDSKGDELKIVIKYPLDYSSCTESCWQDYQDAIDNCLLVEIEDYYEVQNCISAYGQMWGRWMSCYEEREAFIKENCVTPWGAWYLPCFTGSKVNNFKCSDTLDYYEASLDYSDCLSNLSNDYLPCIIDAQINYQSCITDYETCLLNEYEASTGNPKAVSYMALSNMLNTPIEKFTYINSQETEHIKWNYEITSDSIVVLSSTERSYGGEPLITEITYDQYDYKGNPGVVAEKEDGLVTGYIWGYDNTLPIAKITNAAYVPFKYVYNTINNNLSRSRYSPTTGIALNSFTINYFPQDVSFTVDSIYDYNIPALADILITMTIKEISSGETVSTCEFTSGNLYKEVNLEPGSYRIEYSKDANISYYCNFLYNDVTRNWSSSRASEVFYEGFEETGTVDNVVSKTGDYVYCGEYSVPLSDKVEGTYKLTYWTSTDGINWERNDSTITVDEYSTTLNIGSEGVYIDEIRLHPPDAQMTTYTYDPLIGMTSETDPNGLTTYYEYDSFGRLEYIKDNDRNILKAYRYHYADQEQ